MNISLLCKWWWKLDTEKGLWQDIVQYKYLRKKNICTVKHRQNDSAIWADLLKIRHIYLQGRKVKIKNGDKALFWKDSWLFDKPLECLFPDLFSICMQLDISVSQMKQRSVNFTRWLVDNMRLDWNNILRKVEKITLTDGEDMVNWKFDKKGCFSVKSVYKFLTTNDAGIYYKNIWKGKIPAKNKIFLWLVANNALLTRDNMVKRKWTGDPSCLFCECNESVSHLLFQCSLAKAVWAVVAHCLGASNVPRNLNQSWAWCEQWLPYGTKFHAIGIAAICWAIWKTRNSACFEDKVVTSPIHVICYACSLMEYWAGLFLEEDKEQLIAGANTMLKIAMQLVSREVRDQKHLALEDNKSTDEEDAPDGQK